VRIPEWLYNPTPKTFTGVQMQVLNRRGTDTSAAAASITVDIFTVENDQWCVLSAVSGRALAGAAQTITSLLLAGFAQDGAAIAVLKWEFGNANAGRTEGGINWDGEVWLPPSTRVSLSATFNAGVAANQVLGLAASGILIPKGNVGIA
jgi:hypothetical protein